MKKISRSGKKFVQEIHDRLFRIYGVCQCPLQHDGSFQLLIAVMLSAQCRDERVNQVTEKLFALAPTPEKMADAPDGELEEIIKPCGLHKAKSRNAKEAAKMIISRFGGRVPQTMEELIQLPGIGRKSANVVLGNAFDIPGFPVDTHVKRVLNRLGCVDSNDPEKIEEIINRRIAPEYWTNFSHLLIWHGRRVCHAGKRAACPDCVLNDICAAKE